MNKLTEFCKELKNKDQKAFVAYFTAGYPNLDDSFEYIKIAMNSGADIIEVGLPFSDPVADGPTIAEAAGVALESGFRMEELFKKIEDLRNEGYTTPIVLFSYINPLYKWGFERVAEILKDLKVEAVLVVDCPIEESETYAPVFKQVGIDTVMLVSPTTVDDRLRSIVEESDGFVYVISQLGVTGARSEISEDLESQIENIKKYTNKPLYAGFGISSPEQAKEVSRYTDGVIIGSAITKIIKSSESHDAAKSKIRDFIRSIKEAI